MTIAVDLFIKLEQTAEVTLNNVGRYLTLCALDLPGYGKSTCYTNNCTWHTDNLPDHWADTNIQYSLE